MLGRVANNIFWMNRYLERADNMARFIHVNENLRLDTPMNDDELTWKALIDACGDTDDYTRRYPNYSPNNAITFLAFDELNPSSIYSCLKLARENARSIKEIITTEMWACINQLYLYVHRKRLHDTSDLLSFMDHIKHENSVFIGLLDSTMSHNEAWHFSRLGRLIERADKTSRLLDVKYYILLPSDESVGTPFDTIQWGALLKSVSAFEMHLKKYHDIHYSNVVEFLIFDDAFPRSISMCVQLIKKSLSHIEERCKKNNDVYHQIHQLHAILHNCSLNDVIHMGVHEFIDDIQKRLNGLSMAIGRSFFYPEAPTTCIAPVSNQDDNVTLAAISPIHLPRESLQ